MSTPTLTEQAALACLMEVLERRGYIVLGCKPGSHFEVGDKAWSLMQFELDEPFLVVGPTNADDWEQQNDLVAELRPKWKRNLIPAEDGATFYRVQDISHIFKSFTAVRDALKSALDQSGCDGDLCNYQWHEDARAVLKIAGGAE